MSWLTKVLLALSALLTVSGAVMMLWTGNSDGDRTGPQTVASSTSTSTTAPTSRPQSPRPESTSSSTTRPTSPSPTSSPSARAPKEKLDIPAAPQRTAMIAAARTFVGDLGATHRTPKQWWQALEPQLTAQAAEDMSGMEPSWLDPMRVQRGGWVVAADHESGGHEHDSDLATDVVVPTNKGQVTVTLRPAREGSSYDVVQYSLAGSQ